MAKGLKVDVYEATASLMEPIIRKQKRQYYRTEEYVH